ncbi:MAG: hypothetical protein JXB46_10310 [Candidatus Eisenbacteria bacterium]|nr:hypothetical protein [Candidatus Eisenbacteria bacterium]
MRGARFLLVCAVCLLLAGGCGGDGDAEPVEEPTASPSPQASSTSQLTTYTNEEWGFSLEYPAEWIEEEQGAFGNAEAAISFHEPELDGDQVKAMLEGAAWVSVGTDLLPRAGSASDAREVLEAFRSYLVDRSGKAPTPGNPYFEITESRIGEFAGVPCLFVDRSSELDRLKGHAIHTRSHTFVTGDVLYVLELHCLDSCWRENEAQLEAIADSFVLL